MNNFENQPSEVEEYYINQIKQLHKTLKFMHRSIAIDDFAAEYFLRPHILGSICHEVFECNNCPLTVGDDRDDRYCSLDFSQERPNPAEFYVILTESIEKIGVWLDKYTKEKE